jgi:hypothetical protein
VLANPVRKKVRLLIKAVKFLGAYTPPAPSAPPTPETRCWRRFLIDDPGDHRIVVNLEAGEQPPRFNCFSGAHSDKSSSTARTASFQ